MSTDIVGADYQPVVIGKMMGWTQLHPFPLFFFSLGYQTTGDTSHQSKVSYTSKITDFIDGL